MTSFAEFLTAKRTVEDRALNRPVFERFVTELAACSGSDPVRIVEIGAGTGSMITRLAEWNALPPRVSYRAVDIDADTIDTARQQLPEQLAAAGYVVDQTSDRLIATQREENGSEKRLELSFEVDDGFSITDEADAVIASAVLDLVELEASVHDLKGVLSEDGLLYAPITFNGRTSFTPVVPLDGRIEQLYHRHMDEVRDQLGGSRAGQQLLSELPAAGYQILDTGGSDWVIHPVDGEYPAAESTVLSHLLATIDSALADYPPEVIDPTTRSEWIRTRTKQLERGELTLVAHHLDVLAQLEPD